MSNFHWGYCTLRPPANNNRFSWFFPRLGPVHHCLHSFREQKGDRAFLLCRGHCHISGQINNKLSSWIVLVSKSAGALPRPSARADFSRWHKQPVWPCPYPPPSPEASFLFMFLSVPRTKVCPTPGENGSGHIQRPFIPCQPTPHFSLVRAIEYVNALTQGEKDSRGGESNNGCLQGWLRHFPDSMATGWIRRRHGAISLWSKEVVAK